MKNLIDTSHLNKEDIITILNFSDILKSDYQPILKNKSIGMIFEKYSTRTRFSFQVGIAHLMGNIIDIRLDELNLQRIESFDDTFKILGCYLDAIIYRTESHDRLLKAHTNFNKPIINALSEKSHPCQAISDLYTLREYFGSLENIEISWFGDINNVLISLIDLLKNFPQINLNIFTDENIYLSNLDINPFKNLRNINFLFDLDKDKIAKSNCIMTDVYNSMNDKNDKENILKRFQVNDDIMNLTKDSCIFMHCLPAKIGSEVTSSVINGPKSVVLKQAYNRLVAQKGILKWLDI